uniref:Uncharacterized protein n=1 Tax=Peronospora matthiolae TaxID=2874970 RepID=A0AAV1VBQ0_9STRA
MFEKKSTKTQEDKTTETVVTAVYEGNRKHDADGEFDSVEALKGE